LLCKYSIPWLRQKMIFAWHTESKYTDFLFTRGNAPPRLAVPISTWPYPKLKELLLQHRGEIENILKWLQPRYQSISTQNIFFSHSYMTRRSIVGS
jgi:hypothetical protein